MQLDYIANLVRLLERRLLAARGCGRASSVELDEAIAYYKTVLQWLE